MSPKRNMPERSVGQLAGAFGRRGVDPGMPPSAAGAALAPAAMGDMAVVLTLGPGPVTLGARAMVAVALAGGA